MAIRQGDQVRFAIKSEGSLDWHIGVVTELLSGPEAKRSGVIRTGRSGRVAMIETPDGKVFYKLAKVCKPVDR